jgi:DNA-binding winged helix-turn-helix (wHTH) protein
VREKLRFAAFELDMQAHELLKNGRRVGVAPQALRLLEFLATRPRRLVTREEIRQEIWSETTFVDFEQGINKSIRQIRDALNDDAERPRFVETLPRRGYRFIANVEYPGIEPVDEAADKQAPTVPASFVAETAAVPESRPRILTKRRVMFGVAALMLIAAAFQLGLRLERRPRAPAQPVIQSLVVLPFENLSADASEDYLAAGITEELTTNLANIGAMRVISHTSASQYKGVSKPLSQIAEELNVDGVVEGGYKNQPIVCGLRFN